LVAVGEATSAAFAGVMALPFGAVMLASTLADGQPMTTDASGAPVPDTSVEQPNGYDGPVPPDGTLVRQGTDKESASRLGRKAGEAEANGFPHGVSVTTPDANNRLANNPSDSSTATRKQIEGAGFPVVHTPTRRDPDHHTVVLPKPVTPADAQRFNEVFGRSKRPQ
jgi:hypothetical protein